MRSVWLMLLVSLALACSSEPRPELEDPGPGCTTDPAACPPDTTCWPVDVSGRFDCLAAPKDQTPGSPCTIDLGAATCAAGAFCFPTAPSSGICSPVCTSNADCSGGACTSVYVNEAKFRYKIRVCEVTAVADAASD